MATSWPGLSSTMAATMASTSSDMRRTGPTGLLIGVLPPLLSPADVHDVQRRNAGLGHGDVAGDNRASVADHEPGVPRGHPPAHHLRGDLPGSLLDGVGVPQDHELGDEVVLEHGVDRHGLRVVRRLRDLLRLHTRIPGLRRRGSVRSSGPVPRPAGARIGLGPPVAVGVITPDVRGDDAYGYRWAKRSEEHTSEIQSQFHLVS